MSRMTVYDVVNGVALLSLAALLARATRSGGWTGEEALFLLALPMLLIGATFAASILLRRTRRESAEECAACLVLPSGLVLGAMLASLV